MHNRAASLNLSPVRGRFVGSGAGIEASSRQEETKEEEQHEGGYGEGEEEDEEEETASFTTSSTLVEDLDGEIQTPPVIDASVFPAVPTSPTHHSNPPAILQDSHLASPRATTMIMTPPSIDPAPFQAAWRDWRERDAEVIAGRYGRGDEEVENDDEWEEDEEICEWVEEVFGREDVE